MKDKNQKLPVKMVISIIDDQEKLTTIQFFNQDRMASPPFNTALHECFNSSITKIDQGKECIQSRRLAQEDVLYYLTTPVRKIKLPRLGIRR